MITPKHVTTFAKNRRLRKAIRQKISGSAAKPRMVVVKSNKFLYVQVVDDDSHHVLVAASTLEKEIKGKVKSTKDKEAAKLLGETIAERLKEKKIASVVFDRNVYQYTGRIKVLADAAREKGIQF